MFWKVICEEMPVTSEVRDHKPAGRFVLHRHHDSGGVHLDLRLEQDGYLLGWRIDGASLAGEPWATEKPPHPIRWLTQDGDAVRDDGGTYAWVERSADRRVLELMGQGGVERLRLERVPGPSCHAARAISDALAACDVAPEEAAGLIADGVTARRRAVARLLGLGRELDGSGFDEVVWRKTLSDLTLDEIHSQLRSFEQRFDKLHPPQPVSKPESLHDDGGEGRRSAAMAIARE